MFCLFFFKGQIFFTSTSFISGNLVFRLTPLPNSSSYDVLITRNNASDVWTRWINTEYTVKDVLLYDSITINVRTPGSYVDNIVTYNGLVIFFYIHFLGYISQFQYQAYLCFVVAHKIQNILTVHKIFDCFRLILSYPLHVI